MKAMIYADCFNLKQAAKAFAFMIVIFVVSAFVWSGPEFFSMVTVMVSVMMPTSLCSMDKAYGWDRLSLSLPIQRKDVVGSKFLVSLFANLFFVTLSVVVTGVYCALLDTTEKFLECFLGLMLCEAVSLIIMGFSLAVNFKWGVEKSRFIILACVYIPVIAGFVLDKMGVQLSEMSFFETLDNMRPSVLLVISLLIGILVYTLCYMITVKIYQKVEM